MLKRVYLLTGAVLAAGMLAGCTDHRRSDTPEADGDTIELTIGEPDGEGEEEIPVSIIEINDSL